MRLADGTRPMGNRGFPPFGESRRWERWAHYSNPNTALVTACPLGRYTPPLFT